MLNALANFFTPEAGQARRQWLNEQEQRVGNALAYYLGPAADPLQSAALLAGYMTPGADMMDASNAGRELFNAETPMDAATAAATAIAAGGMMLLPGNVGALREGFDQSVNALAAYDPTTVNIFAGPRAATADLNALRSAEEMLASGAPREAVWQETGWFRGPDGQMRFEIDDSAADLSPTLAFRFRPNIMLPGGRLDQVFPHQAFSEAYDIPIDVWPKGTTEAGSYTPPTYWRNDIPSRGVSAGDVDQPGRLVAAGQTPDELRSVMLHELQHAVQTQEGFAPGNSISGAAAYLAAQRDRAMYDSIMSAASPEDLAAIRRHDELRDLWQGQRNIPDEVRQEVEGILARPGVRQINEQLNQIRAMRDQGGYGQGAYESGLVSREDAFDIYNRTAGEVESRAVQARRNMTPEERRANPPWASYDVLEDQQIILNWLAQQ